MTDPENSFPNKLEAKKTIKNLAGIFANLFLCLLMPATTVYGQQCKDAFTELETRVGGAPLTVSNLSDPNAGTTISHDTIYLDWNHNNIDLTDITHWEIKAYSEI